MKRLTIETTEGATEQITILAVTSYEPIYRLAWLFNQQFGWNLAESDALRFMNENNDLQQFPVYAWSDVESGANHYLVQHSEEQGTLMRIVNYWLRLENVENVADIVQKIKGMEEIMCVQEMKPTSQNKKTVIFRNPLYQNNL